MSELVSVGNYSDRFSAEIAQSLLDTEGIDSYIRADDAGGMRPFQLAGAGGVWLIVGEQNAARASALLQAYTQEPGDADPEAKTSLPT